ncbi:hypothetical protein AU210_012404 [Fusarium oxysporum f. sp. radicis-cucumerinum]|uniref:Uncharacterized protein n=1 Tax=Fusarium oxysporum f. sp. radicis-cucumerinum TaxID=327505 RepID=A0A2H3G8A0_FUSOX|nr:hypothetical protein AU210_012404 [Fusarium oxysporum f. sp. radicis-cucumerinum]
MAGEMVFTGPSEILRQVKVRDRELSQYERNLEAMMGRWLYCRVEGKPFEHAAAACTRRHKWFRAKAKAQQECKRQGKGWMDEFAVCWKCYQPQVICRAADPAYEGADKGVCRFPDMVMPLCVGAFRRPGRSKWFLKHLAKL